MKTSGAFGATLGFMLWLLAAGLAVFTFFSVSYRVDVLLIAVVSAVIGTGLRVESALAQHLRKES